MAPIVRAGKSFIKSLCFIGNCFKLIKLFSARTIGAYVGAIHISRPGYETGIRPPIYSTATTFLPIIVRSEKRFI